MSRATAAYGIDGLSVPMRPLHAIILLLFGVVLTWPALSSGYLPSRDGLIHLLWTKNFADQFWTGDLYPRWLDALNGGLGSPAFYFYAPLPYYFTAALRPLFHGDPEGWHQLGVAASIAVILSGFTTYAWLKRICPGTAALIGAVLYMSAPYHLAVDLYQRFAFAELWAFVWMPLIMYGVHSIVSGHRLGPLGLGFAYTALLLTHLPTAMIFSPVPLAYAACFAARGKRARAAALAAGAMVLGAGIAAAYIVPALATQDNVSFATMREEQFSYIYNFLYYGPRFNDDFAAFVSGQGLYAGVMMPISCAAFALASTALVGAERRYLRFWIAVAGLAFAMMLPLARFVWDLVPPLQAIQFPWRFNTVLTFSMAILIALWARSLEPTASGLKAVPFFIACAVVIGQSLPTLASYLALAGSPGAPSMDKMLVQFGPFSREAKEKVEAAKLGIDVTEYRPRWVPPEFLSQAEKLRKFLSEDRETTSIPKASRTTILSRGTRHIVVGIDAPAGGWVTVAQFYYPGWRAAARDGSALSVRPSASTGLLEVEVPPGKRDIVVQLETGIEERIGWAISAISVVLLFVLAVLLRRRHSSR